MLARDDDNRRSSTMGTWTSFPARGSCWACWPNRTGSGRWPRSPSAPPACPRWRNGPAWSRGRRRGRSAGWSPAACSTARPARATGSAPRPSRRPPSRRPAAPDGTRSRGTRCCAASSPRGGCWPCRPRAASAWSCSTTWPACSSPAGATPSRRSTSCSGATTPTTPCSAATWSTTASWTGPTRRGRGRARSRSTGAPAAPSTPSTCRRLLLPEPLAGLGEGRGQGVAQRRGRLLGLLPDLRVADGVAEGAERLVQRVPELLEGLVDLAPVGGRRRLALLALLDLAPRPGALVVVLLHLASQGLEVLADLVPGRLALCHLPLLPSPPAYAGRRRRPSVAVATMPSASSRARRVSNQPAGRSAAA